MSDKKQPAEVGPVELVLGKAMTLREYLGMTKKEYDEWLRLN